MHALLVDSPAAPASEQPSTADRQAGGSAGPPEGGVGDQSGAGRACTSCEAPLRDGQAWCLQCGAGQPGSLGSERPDWRPLSTLTLLAILLCAAAAVAGAAASSKHKTPPRTLTVAQAPLPGTPTTSTPTTSTPTASTPTTSAPVTPGTAHTPKIPLPKAAQGETGASNPLFPSTGTPPKIPSAAATPKATGTGTATGTGESTHNSTTGSSEKSTTESKPSGESKSEQPSAILLDTNAASTYNPYNYPEAGFGDPALAIDGEVSTAWKAQVQPHLAPNMAEGLVIDLNRASKVGAVKLITGTLGMTVQIYGAKGHKPPATITEPGWTLLSASHILRRKSTRLKLRDVGKGFRFVLVWIVKAPEAAVGTPQVPGSVDLNEVELFPSAS